MKRLQRSLLAQRFCHVDPFVSAVVSRSRVPFRIFVRHDRTERFQNRSRGEILRRNQLQAFPLSFFFSFDDVKNFRVHGFQIVVTGFRPRDAWFELGVRVRVGGVVRRGRRGGSRFLLVLLFARCVAKKMRSRRVRARE